jgi:hypothetical protein
MCEIIVTDTDVDVYVAIDRAAERAGHCLAHVIERGTMPPSSPVPVQRELEPLAVSAE